MDRIAHKEIFTPEDFTEEHKMIADLTEKFVFNRVMPVLDRIEDQEFAETLRLMKEAGELGLIGAVIAEEDGGAAIGEVGGAIISEIMAVGRSFSITFGGQTGIGVLPIAYFGNKAQKEQYLPGLLSGEQIAAYALTEPSSGTDALSMKTRAVRSECGDYYILNGEKQWITNSGFADIFIVYAKVDGDKITAFIVERELEGLTVGPEEKKMGLKGSSTCSVIMDNVKVPVENVLGEIGRGHIIALNVLNMGRFKLSVYALGLAKRSISLAVNYANDRFQFGQPISSFNLIKQKIADMAIRTYANESAVYRTAGALEEAFATMQVKGGQYDLTIADFTVECSINKVMSTEALDFIIDETLQIHGGYGYMAEYEVEAIYRDSRINRIFEGTNEINRLLIASTLLKHYKRGDEQNRQFQDDLLQQEKQTLQLMKEYFHSAIQAIQQAELGQLKEEQELASFLADLAIAIYSVESAVLRADKAIAKSGAEKKAQMLDYVKMYAHESAQRCAVQGLNMLNHLNSDELFSYISRLISSSTHNLVEVKRRIADRVIAAETYLV